MTKLEWPRELLGFWRRFGFCLPRRSSAKAGRFGLLSAFVIFHSSFVLSLGFTLIEITRLI
jgi:hypothetical protein